MFDKLFQNWFKEFVSECDRLEIPINEDDPELYRDYFDGDFTPEEAAGIEDESQP